jgi:hypothetical protein
MLLALCPSRDRIEPRRAIRMGFTALRRIASSMRLEVNYDPDPDSPIELSFGASSDAVEHLSAVGFPLERSPEEAWPHFRGWRVNYESLAYRLCLLTDAVPAPWSGARRWRTEPISVQRPPDRRPSDASRASQRLKRCTDTSFPPGRVVQQGEPEHGA